MRRKDFFKSLLMGGTGIFLIHGPAKATTRWTCKKSGWQPSLSQVSAITTARKQKASLKQACRCSLTASRITGTTGTAIEILSGEAKLGYVPRAENKTIAKLMDKGIMVYKLN